MMNIFIFVPLMSVLHFICGEQLNLRDGNITFHTEHKTWAEAQTYCRTHHTDLITNRKETVDLNSTQRAWIGLYREDKASEWKWSTGEKATFFRWNNNNNCCCYCSNKNSCYGGEGCNCVYKKYQQNKWCCGKCCLNLAFFCYDEILVLVKENKTWEEALEHCRNMKEMKNYTLATLNTPDDHDFAREKAQLATTEEVWTGLRYLGDEWFWMGGEPVQYQNIPSCPAVRCGVLEKNSNSSFGIRDCNERRNFFCYIKPKKYQCQTTGYGSNCVPPG